VQPGKGEESKAQLAVLCRAKVRVGVAGGGGSVVAEGMAGEVAFQTSRQVNPEGGGESTVVHV